ncbi:probable ATP-dependent DNA helicase RecS [Ostrea edulis]|uniref:probable ATP-dependent DNA helicase RecS n=1 Tax=Ostrea edulis TaxID=37623 RepID=UPI0024AF53CD|nr:probable ATP-dependent DNA helicase RecS [Ostrea edulis]
MASYENVIQLFNVEKLKDQQKGILYSILRKRHTVAVLPTGYGKSLPYQRFIPIMRERLGENEETPKVIVCCPLVALMEDQVNRVKGVAGLRVILQRGMRKSKLGTLTSFLPHLKPLLETLSGNFHIQKLNVGLLVIDEFHTIATWVGDETDEEEGVFRKWFRHIGEFRSLHPSATILALSETCT